MAEDSDLEKTESATPRRLQKAREEGQIVRSRELSTFALLAAGFYGVWGMSGSIGEHLQNMLRASLTFDHASSFETSRMLIGAGAASREGLYALLPVLGFTGLAALLAPLALGGWQLSAKGFEAEVQPAQSDCRLRPDVFDQRADPARHVAREDAGGGDHRRHGDLESP